MFDTLSDKLQHALGDLRGRGRLDEESVSKAMREIRLALLEADVNLGVVKEFVARVKERAVGADVTKSLTPGPGGREDRPRGADRDHGRQRLPARLRAARQDRDPARRPPGLGQDDRRRQARADAAQGREARPRSSPPTCSARPRSTSSSSSASRSRSRSTARSARIRSRPPSKGVEQAEGDVVIVDTAGRHQVDADLMDELERIARRRQADERPARARRDDRPGGRERRGGVPGDRSPSTGSS